MDKRQFDELTRSLASGRNRRSLLKMVGAAALGTAGLTGIRGSVMALRPPKVGMCHNTNNRRYTYIAVPASEVAAHLAHGDVVSNLDDIENCHACGNACVAPEHGTAVCGVKRCQFTCDEPYQLSYDGDTCDRCQSGFEFLNGSCFQIVTELEDCLSSCGGYAYLEGASHKLCGWTTGADCQHTADCAHGDVCDVGGECISACYPT